MIRNIQHWFYKRKNQKWINRLYYAAIWHRNLNLLANFQKMRRNPDSCIPEPYYSQMLKNYR